MHQSRDPFLKRAPALSARQLPDEGTKNRHQIDGGEALRQFLGQYFTLASLPHPMNRLPLGFRTLRGSSVF